MTEWWESANPGGPMVGPPMARPLYPPDAISRGKTPSDDGKDVQAIKRGVSRSGHWPWQTFDDQFSNAFSHGKSGNVSENGLAGLQRQNGIDDTGWMGEATYNLIRSALIPDGLPHAGEPILDDIAIDLLWDYRKEQAGGETTIREQALAFAKTFIGYRESPPGTNGNMFGAWYGMNYEPWCAIFATYCYEKASDGNSPLLRGQRYSYVPFLVFDARNRRNGLSLTTSPQPGNLVAYDWRRDGMFDHAGLFEKGTSLSWTAIEGNTAVGNDSNGGQVMRRERSAGQGNIVFVKVREL